MNRYVFEGSGAAAAMRVAFGDVTNEILAKMTKEDRIAKVAYTCGQNMPSIHVGKICHVYM